MSYSQSRQLARRYAQALLNHCSTQKSMTTTEEELTAIAGIISSHAHLSKLESMPSVSKKQIHDVWDALGKKMKLSNQTLQFMHLLVEKERITLTPVIADMFSELLDEKLERIQVRVVTASKITAKKLKSITDTIKSWSGKKPVIEHEEDPSILGGTVLYAGSKMLDASLSHQLNQLRTSLTLNR